MEGSRRNDFEDDQVIRPRERSGQAEGANTMLGPHRNNANMDDADMMMGDQEMLSASANANFNQYKAEQRTLLETRN